LQEDNSVSDDYNVWS